MPFSPARSNLSVADLVTAIDGHRGEPVHEPREDPPVPRRARSGSATPASRCRSCTTSCVTARPSTPGSPLADATIAGWLDESTQGPGAPRHPRRRRRSVVQRISALLPLDPALTQRGDAGHAARRQPPPSQRCSPTRGSPSARTDGSFATPSDRANFGGIFDAFVVLDKLRIVLARWRVSTARCRSGCCSSGRQVGWLRAAHAARERVGSGSVTLAKLDMLRHNVVVQQTLVAANESRLFDVVLQRSQRPRRGRGGPRGARRLVERGRDRARRPLRTGPRAQRSSPTPPRPASATSWPGRASSAPTSPRRLTFVTRPSVTATERAQGAPADQGQVRSRQVVRHRGLDPGSAARAEARRAGRLAAGEPERRARPALGQRRGAVRLLSHRSGDVAVCDDDADQASRGVGPAVRPALLPAARAERVGEQRRPTARWTQWEWMKRFRLWEANRKIFLYPENWIDPSQRRDKSPFFSELEDELQQSDLSQDAAEDALLNYLHKLAEVSHLEICGMCEQTDYGQTAPARRGAHAESAARALLSAAGLDRRVVAVGEARRRDRRQPRHAGVLEPAPARVLARVHREVAADEQPGSQGADLPARWRYLRRADAVLGDRAGVDREATRSLAAQAPEQAQAARRARQRALVRVQGAHQRTQAGRRPLPPDVSDADHRPALRAVAAHQRRGRAGAVARQPRPREQR